VENVRNYVRWAIKRKGLAPDTVKVYLSDLKLAHKLRDFQLDWSNDFFINSMLKGAKNLSLYKSIFKPARFVMSFHLLKILGHEIATCHWDSYTKTLYWAACCIAFFGSFRLALWNDSRTRAVKGGRTLGEKHATFTADFRAYRAISGDPHKIKISSQYMPLYFL
jgi:hypothetical protein